MHLKLILIELRWFLIKGYFKTLMGHATTLCLINVGSGGGGGSWGVNERVSTLMKIKRLSLIKCKVGRSFCGCTSLTCSRVTSSKNGDGKRINPTLSFTCYVRSIPHAFLRATLLWLIEGAIAINKDKIHGVLGGNGNKPDGARVTSNGPLVLWCEPLLWGGVTAPPRGAYSPTKSSPRSRDFSIEKSIISPNGTPCCVGLIKCAALPLARQGLGSPWV